ncbi:MAG: hypothetical protein FD138_2820 [Planctomycetota bacterium]|nr:MAG: hypothetical protein FD138_2820 [Planctomycetota bacterium]
MDWAVDRMLTSFAARLGKIVIASPELAQRMEVETSSWQPCSCEGRVGLVLKLKERNLSTRTRLSDFAWRFPEECSCLGANELGRSESIHVAMARSTSDQREWTNGLVPSQALG